MKKMTVDEKEKNTRPVSVCDQFVLEKILSIQPQGDTKALGDAILKQEEGFLSPQSAAFTSHHPCQDRVPPLSNPRGCVASAIWAWMESVSWSAGMNRHFCRIPRRSHMSKDSTGTRRLLRVEA